MAWTENNIKDVITNPVYVGIGPYPQIIQDDVWIATAQKSLSQMGAKEFFGRMLRNLRLSFPTERTLGDGESE